MEATKLKDLKIGDDFTGRIGDKEYIVEGDTITMSSVTVTSEALTGPQLAEARAKLTAEIDRLQTQLAEANLRTAKLVE